MIKKIKTSQLRPGIFVDDFNCDWAGDNIFISKALIKNEKSVEIIRSWGIKEVYIDTDKGLDIKDAKTAREVRQETDKAILKMAKKQNTIPLKIPLKEELKVASSIKNEAVGIMEKTIQSVQKGKKINTELSIDLVGKMKESVNRNKDALLLLTRMRNKDEYTLMHSISVSSLVLAFCSSFDVPYDLTIKIAMGALFHDIGKTRIPDKILNKPAKLTNQEFTIMKKHSEHSADVLKDAQNIPMEAYDIALHHHERCDGSGYPHGLKSDAIQFGSKIVSICDVYDAISSERCYKHGLERVEGLRKMYGWSDHYFDKELTYKFIRCIGVYPVGTCVKLENELIGIVTGSTDNVLQPVVRLFYNDEKKKGMEVEEVNLSEIGVNVASYESANNWDHEKKKIFNNLKNSLNPLQ